jgi:hypothetical protein
VAYEVFVKGGNNTFVFCSYGLLRLSPHARALLGCDLVELLLDPAAARAAIRPVAATTLNTYRIGKNGSISCIAFLKAIHLRKAGKIPATWDRVNRRLEWTIPALNEDRSEE